MGRFLNLYREKGISYTHLAFSYQEDSAGRFDPVLFQTQAEAEAARIAGVKSLHTEFGFSYEGTIIDLDKAVWKDK